MALTICAVLLIAFLVAKYEGRAIVTIPSVIAWTLVTGAVLFGLGVLAATLVTALLRTL
jgi:hypothetical protein